MCGQSCVRPVKIRCSIGLCLERVLRKCRRRSFTQRAASYGMNVYTRQGRDVFSENWIRMKLSHLWQLFYF